MIVCMVVQTTVPDRPSIRTDTMVGSKASAGKVLLHGLVAIQVINTSVHRGMAAPNACVAAATSPHTPVFVGVRDMRRSVRGCMAASTAAKVAAAPPRSIAVVTVQVEDPGVAA